MITITKHTKRIIITIMINDIAFISMLVSFSLCLGVCAYVAIPHDIKDIKRILRDIKHG